MKALSHFPDKRESFSSVRDFALVLLPITIGVAYILIREFTPGMVAGQYHFTGVMKQVFDADRSALFRIFIYGMFLFGLASLLRLLRGLRRLEEADEKRLESE